MAEREIVRVVLRGHLTKDLLDRELGVVKRTGEMCLLVDCLEMTSYDTDARTYFVEWHRKMRRASRSPTGEERIERTAIVLRNPLWRIVVAAMRLAANMPMTAFETLDEAERWLLAPRDVGQSVSK
jgi:hypothetical protein